MAHHYFDDKVIQSSCCGQSDAAACIILVNNNFQVHLELSVTNFKEHCKLESPIVASV